MEREHGREMDNAFLRDSDLAQRMEFERIVGSISSDFVRLSPGKVSEGIESALATMGEFTGADRAYVFQFRDNLAITYNTHEWCADGIEPQIEALQDVPAASLPWWMGKLVRLEPIQIPSVRDLPPDARAEKEILEAQGIQSLVVVPLAMEGQLIGFLGFDAVRKQRTWGEDDLVLLQLVGETITHALDRDQAARALAEQADRFRTIYNSASEALMMLDETSFFDCNAMTLELFGVESMEQFCSLHPAELSPPVQADGRDSLAAANDRIQTALREGNHRFEWLHKRRDTGEVFPAEVILTAMTLDGRRVLHASVRDITERKRHDEQRRVLDQKLQQTQRLESLGVLAGGIAHDFNNILMAIMGHCELALDEMSPVSPARENMVEVISSAKRAANLCEQMLAYSGRGRMEIQDIALRDLAEEMHHMLKTSIGKNCIFNMDLAEEPVGLHGDPTQICQVLMNLVINAAEAIGEQRGTITLATGSMECSADYLEQSYIADGVTPGRYVFLEVSDTGCGIDSETMQRLFDPFFTTKFAGRGLGLSAVLGIVRSHNGAIRVQGEQGKGTTVTVLFPAVPLPNDRAMNAGDSAEWQAKGTALLVDDEPSVRHVTEKMLRKLGLEVITAKDGREAVDLYRRHWTDIDIVLLDLTMPHMNGEETFRELRRINPDVRAILASGYSEHELASRVDVESLLGCLHKPYTTSKLLNLLSEALPG